MTEAEISGHEVTKQANDNSITNTEPAIVAGAVVGIVGAVGSILVIGGYIDEGQKNALADSAGQIVPAVFVIAAIVQAVITRMRAYAPRTAARIAVANATAPAGTPPTLQSPP
jgi:hypothetical protein